VRNRLQFFNLSLLVPHYSTPYLPREVSTAGVVYNGKIFIV